MAPHEARIDKFTEQDGALQYGVQGYQPKEGERVSIFLNDGKRLDGLMNAITDQRICISHATEVPVDTADFQQGVTQYDVMAASIDTVQSVKVWPADDFDVVPADSEDEEILPNDADMVPINLSMLRSIGPVESDAKIVIHVPSPREADFGIGDTPPRTGAKPSPAVSGSTAMPGRSTADPSTTPVFDNFTKGGGTPLGTLDNDLGHVTIGRVTGEGPWAVFSEDTRMPPGGGAVCPCTVQLVLAGRPH